MDFRNSAAAALILGLCGPLLALDPTTPRFYFATFTNNSTQTTLYLTESLDGRRFDVIGNAPVYHTPAPDTLRDPSIIHLDDAYYVCHTAGSSLGNAPYFSVLRSVDLVHWTKVTDVSTASVPDTRYTWAPEWFRDTDGSDHVFVAVSYYITREFVLYEVHPTNAAMTEWSEPARVTGSAFPAFPHSTDPQNVALVGVYDAQVFRRGAEYFMTYFDNPTGYICCAKAPALLGPYTVVRSGNWQGIGDYKEGGNMVWLGEKNWRFYYANAIYSFMSYVESADDWATWSLPVVLDTDVAFNHGTVIYNPAVPIFQAEVSQNSGTEIRFPAFNRNAYQLEMSANLAEWEPVGGVILGTGATATRPIAADAKPFQRVRWLPFYLVPQASDSQPNPAFRH